MKPTRVCVDASFVLKALVPEVGTDEVLSLLSAWRREGTVLFAPTLIEYEVVSVLRKYVFRNLLTSEEGNHARILFSSLPLDLQPPGVFLPLAWKLAEQLSLATIYDPCYLALSEKLVCPLWTADMRFVNSVAVSSPGYKVARGRSGAVSSLTR